MVLDGVSTKDLKASVELRAYHQKHICDINAPPGVEWHDETVQVRGVKHVLSTIGGQQTPMDGLKDSMHTVLF